MAERLATPSAVWDILFIYFTVLLETFYLAKKSTFFIFNSQWSFFLDVLLNGLHFD